MTLALFLLFPLTAFYIFIVAKTMDTIDGVDGLAAGIAAIAAANVNGDCGIRWSASSCDLSAAADRGDLRSDFLSTTTTLPKIFMGTGGGAIARVF